MFEKIKQSFRTTVSNDAQDYYEVGFEFNTHWVSLDYPENRRKTANIIRNLMPREPIVLKWSNTPFRGEDHVKVYTRTNKQIGWVPHGCSDELETAVKNRWPVEAYIKRTGKVQDPSKNIWWAVVEGIIKIPCAPGTVMVYMTSKSRYHLREDCGNAKKRRVPLEIALQQGGVPCPHCAGSNEQQND